MAYKWADYCIFAVGYDSDKTRIIQVAMAEDLGQSVGALKYKERQYVVSQIKAGKTFVTVKQDGKATYIKGQNVEIFRLGNEEFIRTAGNNTSCDNLGELPEF